VGEIEHETDARLVGWDRLTYEILTVLKTVRGAHTP
jgi:hypothetical protein